MAAATGVSRSDTSPERRRRRPSLRGLVASPRLVLLRQLPAVSGPLTFAAVACVLVSAGLPLASTLASGTLVGRIPAAVEGGLGSPAGRGLLSAVVLIAALYLGNFTVVPLLNQATNALSRRLDRHLSNRVMAAIL